jgi:hypothetical protein
VHTPSRWIPGAAPSGTPEEERTSGGRHYLDVLAAVHRTLEPRFYLEIGVRRGKSLSVARCAAIGVDPAPEVDASTLPSSISLSAMTSDDFFAGLAANPLPQIPDLAFIDGMHLFEFALRDFINIERLSSPTSLVVIDDIFPSHPAQAERERRTRVWTGDVWKLQRCLAELRPDLILLTLDTAPTGLLLVAGLDPDSRVLSDCYEEIVRQHRDDEAPPPAVLARAGAWAATPSASDCLPMLLKRCRDAGATRQEILAALRDAIASGAGE